MEERVQKMRLIVNGAINIYESEGLDIPTLLKQQNRPDLIATQDAILTALYWLQTELAVAR